MKRITSLDELNQITDTFFIKSCLTNNYMLSGAYETYIKERRLWYISESTNAAILLEKADFFQVYFYLNDLTYPMVMAFDKPVVMEILYRGNENKPVNMINYWQNNGFIEHLSRDNMVATWDKLNAYNTEDLNIQIKFAKSSEEMLFTRELFDQELDLYTGDRLTDEELMTFFKNNNLLCAYYQNNLAGVLQFEVKNKVVWLGHVAIHPDFRGKGIANALVNSYLYLNKTEDKTKYSLWVIQDNMPAINLYRKFGFFYGNKSTVSMLKFN